MIHVLLLEDHAVLRQLMADALANEPDIEVVGQVGCLADAESRLEGVDVAVVDLTLPDGSGLDLLPDLDKASPEAKMLILTGSNSKLNYAEAVEAGVAGVLNKSAGMEAVVAAIRRVSRGEVLMSPTERRELMRLAGQERDKHRQAEALLRQLTPREREVLELLAEGLRDREIAERLTVTTDTVRGYVSAILHKLRVRSRSQAMLWAVKQGAIRLE